MKFTRIAAAVAGLGLALSMSACSSSSTDTADANAAYCEGSAKVQSEIDKLEALIVSGAPAEEVKSQRDFVQSAIQANSVPLSQLQSAVQTDVEAANDAFTESVEAIDEDAPLTETAPSYIAAIDAWNTSVDTIDAEVGCA